MIYKIYPVLHWLAKTSVFVAMLWIGKNIFLWHWWIIIMAWPVSIIATLIVDTVLLKICPRAVFINKEEVTGLGYTHSNVHWFVSWTIFIFVVMIFVGIKALIK